jgi:hypothetical protein
MPDGRRWRLVFQFEYHIGKRYSLDKITVPVNFITDFASSPFFIWSLIPPFGKYTKAAVLHDYIYQTHCRTRKEADDIFYEAMLVSGTKKYKARLMHWGVRLFGFLAWKGAK